MKHVLTLALAALLLSSCGDGKPGANNAALECITDSDCERNLACRVNLCTLTESSPRSLGFRLTPPPASTYPPQTVAIRELPADEPMQIGLDPGVRVAGTLTWVGSAAGPGTGRLKFRLRGASFAAEAAVENDSYELYVPAGDYDITFFPGDPERPTAVWKEVTVELDTDPKLQIVSRTIAITGTLSRTDAMSRESAAIAGARVFATARESGATSSTAVTSENGNFEFAVSPDAGVFDLHVAPAEPNVQTDNGAAYVPEATFEEAFDVDGDEWVNLENPQAEVLGLSLGEYGYAPIAIPFRLEVEGGEALDWSGTSVTLKTQAGRGILSVRHRLEADGEFELPLVLGRYTATVRTPPSLPVRSMEIAEVELDEDGVVLQLQRRANVRGTIHGPNGSALPRTELTFFPMSEDGLAEQTSVTTDENGEYTAWLEKEPYMLTVVPPDPTLPRKIVVIEDAAVPDVIAIAQPVLVWGTVFGTPSEGSTDDWRQLPDVSVEVLEKGADGSTRVIGEAQTSESGEFKVVIGARP